MRALVLSALVLASVSPVALLACNQDYAASDEGRETFMGDTKQVLQPQDAAAPKAPPIAPPQMGPLPPPPLVPQLDASTDAAAAASARPGAPARAPTR